MNSALSGVELKQDIYIYIYIYKKLILRPARGELFFSFSTYVIPLYYSRPFGIRLKPYLELNLKYFPTL